MNYYNEFDPHAAAWLRELIARNLIPAGVVDDRSITEIKPHELDGYTQCHFFCGLAGWPLALQLAGWPSTRPVGTGSCPCQPYSAAGKGLGDKDPRNLWPPFRDLILACRELGQQWAFRVFGEQVESAIGHGWLDGVSADMEAEGYTIGAVVLGAHSVGAPHIRQRLYWMANAENSDRGSELAKGSTRSGRSGFAGSRAMGIGLADSIGASLQGHSGNERDGNQPGRIDAEPPGSTAEGGAALQRVGDTESRGLGIVGNETQPGSSGHSDSASDIDGMGIANGNGRKERDQSTSPARHGNTSQPASGWSDSRLILCRDGKHRRIPVERAFFPLADAGIYMVPGMARRRTVRPALLRGSGNAIVPQVAAEFIQACEEVLNQPQP